MAPSKFPSQRCQHEGCGKRPSYGVIGGKALYCAAHESADMVRVRGATCDTLTCHKVPLFGIEGGKAVSCADHKSAEHVNIMSKRCKHAGCTKQPNFGIAGGKASHCADHKTESMVNVVTKRCEEAGCNKVPSFGMVGGRPRFCTGHKLAGMICLQGKLCEAEGCTTQAHFAFEGEGKRLCGTHKLAGMINTGKACNAQGCTALARFGFEGEKVQFCSSHRKTGMVDPSFKRCTVSDCTRLPRYGFDKGDAPVCVDHKKEGMFDIMSPRCRIEGCMTSARMHNKYDGHCLRCYINLFPDNPISRAYKTKETAVVDAIKAHFGSRAAAFTFDRKVDGACSSRRRPDVMCDLGTHVLMSEVDENGHPGYGTTCEHKRVMLLMQDVGTRPVVVLRINPDAYTDAKGVRHPSCFTYHKGWGVPYVPPERKKDWNARLSVLMARMDYWMKYEGFPEKEVTIEHLFYNEPHQA